MACVRTTWTMALIRIFYCICDRLFNLWKIFSFLRGKWVQVSPSLCLGFYFIRCQTQLIFSPRCPSKCSCWRMSMFSLYLSSGPMLLHSPIEISCTFYLVPAARENIIINKELVWDFWSIPTNCNALESSPSHLLFKLTLKMLVDTTRTYLRPLESLIFPFGSYWLVKNRLHNHVTHSMIREIEFAWKLFSSLFAQ